MTTLTPDDVERVIQSLLSDMDVHKAAAMDAQDEGHHAEAKRLTDLAALSDRLATLFDKSNKVEIT